MVRIGRRRAVELAVLGIGSGVVGRPSGGHDGDDDPLEYTVLEWTPTTSTPTWYRDDDAAAGHVTVIDDEDRLRELYRDASRGRRDEFPDELADVDFEESVVILVESIGPTACYDELVVDDVALDDGTLTGSARAVESEADVCAQVLTFPATFVVATVDDEPPTAAEIDVTDGWGETDTVTATADEPLPEL